MRPTRAAFLFLSQNLTWRRSGTIPNLVSALSVTYNAAMPRIPKLDRTQVDEPTQHIFDHFLHERGNIPNMFRTVAHRPEILRTLIAHFRAIMETGTISKKLKELVIVRTSQINRCEY